MSKNSPLELLKSLKAQETQGSIGTLDFDETKEALFQAIDHADADQKERAREFLETNPNLGGLNTPELIEYMDEYH